MAAGFERWDFKTPDETHLLERGRIEVIHAMGGLLRRFVLEPGWRDTAVADESAGAGWDANGLLLYHAAGRVSFIGPGGAAVEARPGHLTRLSPGFSARVLGEDPVILVDFFDLVAPVWRFPPGADSSRPAPQ